MELSINSNDTVRIVGFEKAIEIFSEIGFDCYDASFFDTKSEFFGDGYKEYCKKLKEKGDSLKIRCNQAHAPFPSVDWGMDDFNEKRFDELVRSMECAALLGAEIIVVHPVHKNMPKSVDEYAVNKEFYEKLIPYAEKFGIKVATENMFKNDPHRNVRLTDVCNSPEKFVKMIDLINSPWITACLDVGHCGLVGEDATEMIYALGHDRLKALHIHDNCYILDEHTSPFLGKMDWESICKALSDINYDGVFTFETYLLSDHMPHELMPDALRFIHAVGRHLIKKIKCN